MLLKAMTRRQKSWLSHGKNLEVLVVAMVGHIGPQLGLPDPPSNIKLEGWSIYVNEV